MPTPTEMTKADLDAMIADVVGRHVTELRTEMEAKRAGKTDGAILGELLAQFKSGTLGATDGENRYVAPGADRRGLGVARTVRALAACKGNLDGAIAFARDMWGKDSEPVRALDFAKQKAMAATDPGTGGVFLPPQQWSEVIELLRPASAVRKLNPTIVPLSGTLPIPAITGGATASYTAENTDITETTPTTGDVTLIEKELAALVVLSNRLLRSPQVSVDMMIRDDIVAALAQRSDLAFIRGAGTANSPRGIRFWVLAAQVLAATGGNTLATITSGLGGLINFLLSGNSRMIRPGWLFSGRTYVRLITVRDGNGNLAFAPEMAGGTLFGYPYAFSTQIPNTFTAASAAEVGGALSEVMLQDFADIVVGEGEGLQVDASGEAAYVDSAGSVRAAFSRNQTVIRALEYHDLVARHRESIAVLTDVDWTI